MAKEYCRQVHTHVTIQGMADPFPIALVTGHNNWRVWVFTMYADELPERAVQVGDGLTTGYDEDGQRIVSVPSDLCTYWTDEEAACIANALD